MKYSIVAKNWRKWRKGNNLFDEIKVSFWGDKNALEVDSNDSRTEIMNGPKL